MNTQVIDGLLALINKRTGWDYKYTIKGEGFARTITLEAAMPGTDHSSRLVFGITQGAGLLREIYGRTRHLYLSAAEEYKLAEALRAD